MDIKSGLDQAAPEKDEVQRTEHANAPSARAKLSRRDFLGLAAVSAAAVAASRVPGLGFARGGERGTTTRYPLRIPPLAAPGNFNLTAASATVDVGGQSSSVLAYNGSFPGPTFIANKGDSANIQFTNGLSEGTTVHWHGMIVPTAADGQPQDLVAPGASYAYQFPIVQRACLNWYHPHPHMETGKQVVLGLAGAFIINDAEEAALGLPSGAYEVPLIVRDANFNSAGNLIYNPTSSGFLAKNPMVNGTRNPKLDVDTALYRFRVLNGASARLFKLALSNGAPFHLIGNDGGLLATAVQVNQIEFSPGERLDVLVDFRGLAVGTKVNLQDVNTGWILLEFNVTRAVTDSHTIPTALSTITPLSNPVTTRTFSFDGMTRINGKEYDHNRIDFQVPFGQTE
ncbi:MAG TPA: multicopper oxidase domain-containing protein, partial [Anaerolineales bacterium]|nr:multicopper oxidase domain-containing protein [Anaerolineales bacterium]